MDNRERLGLAGIDVCTESHKGLGLIANCISLANAVLRPSLMTVARMTGDAKSPGAWHYAKAVTHVAKFLSNDAAAHFVLSAEAFCFARETSERAKIEKMFRASDVEVIPVVCFRNEDAWRESWSDEIDRWTPKFRRPHGEGMGDIRADWYFDEKAILGFWRQIGDVRAIDFDEAVGRDRSILPSLLNAMEIEQVGDLDTYFRNART
jgi:hypothetical protein